MVKVGILGTGVMGENHIRNLLLIEGFSIVFIFDSDHQKALHVGKKYGLNAVENLNQHMSEAESVIVCTPSETHDHYIRLAAPIMKYIFVEKPMTDTMASSMELIHFLNNQKTKIQVGFIERYNQAILLLKKNLIGKHVINMQFIRTNKTSNRIRDIDVVMDLMIHDIDLAIMFNVLASRITSFGFVSDGLIAHAVAVILHENNVISTLIASKISEKKKRQIDVTCLGYYYDVNLLSKEIEITKETQEIYNEDTKVSKVVDVINVIGPEALYSELLDFYKLSNGHDIKVPDEEDALSAIKIANWIQQQILNK